MEFYGEKFAFSFGPVNIDRGLFFSRFTGGKTRVKVAPCLGALGSGIAPLLMAFCPRR
jgi:hypothetical protein